jgi:hypothetical protein
MGWAGGQAERAAIQQGGWALGYWYGWGLARPQNHHPGYRRNDKAEILKKFKHEPMTAPLILGQGEAF